MIDAVGAAVGTAVATAVATASVYIGGGLFHRPDESTLIRTNLRLYVRIYA